ncbi:hypothetical protein [Maribacter thermophilus]|uniref:hypothetical protein n=1 Tax=Maribacter thermophilus TaxID=1197874 RepID=UPI0006416B32|nr:hypothetical protein [Maribacter thermophilus]
MKSVVLAITLILSTGIYAQNEFENTNVFVRVYDLEGKKVGRGKIYSITETSLQLYRKEVFFEIPVSNIGSIRTKRSAGNNILVGAATGATSMAVLGAATADPNATFFAYSVGEGAGAGALLGATLGAGIGGITVLFKNSKSYEISGDKVKWKAFKEMILPDK